MSDTDVTGDLFSMFADLKFSVNGINKRLDDQIKQQRALWKSLQETPRYVRIHAVTTLTAGGFGILRFDNDGPDTGHMWYLRKLAISGVTPSTTVAGRGDVYVSAMDLRSVTSLANLGTVDWVDQAPTLPLVGTFGTGEIPIQHQEQLFVVVSGGTNGQEIHATGMIEDFQTGAYKQDWAL